MNTLSKYKNEIILAIIIAASYFFLRLIFLNKLPIFTDEAIYLRWAQIALQDSSWRFISLTDGKQPMFVWFAMIFIKFIQDPLVAGRLVSVFAGFFTLIGVFFLTYELFKNKTMSFLSSILYVFYPFAQVYDRMALYDSMVGAFFVWALYFSVLLVKKVRLDAAYTLAFVIGAGVLTKTSNFFAIYLLPFTALLFDFKKKDAKKNFFVWIGLAAFASIVSFLFYNVLRLSPLFQMISAKNALFVYPLSEWLTHPFTFFVGNLHGLFSWLLEYLTIPYIILIVISIVLIKKDFKQKILLLLYCFIPFFALALFGRIIFPRFIYFMSLMLIPLAAWGLKYILNQSYKYLRKKNAPKAVIMLIPVLIFAFVVYPGIVSYQFASDPVNSKIAKADNSQYVNSWAAGWGVRATTFIIERKAKKEKVFIGTEGTFGLMPEALEMYLIKNKNVVIKGYWPLTDFPKEAIDYSSKMPSYFVFYQKEHAVIPPEYPLQLVFQIRQGNSDSFYRLYQIVPPANNK